MAGKLPPETAFQYYMAQGPGRSYREVSKKFGVSKRAVTRLAAKDHWQSRTLEIEKKAREAANQKAVETLEGMNDRHLKTLHAIQVRAIEVLKQKPIETAMDAVRALGLAIREERLIRGEPSSRTALSMEEVIRKEYESWMTVKMGDEEEHGETDGDVQQDPLLP